MKNRHTETSRGATTPAFRAAHNSIKLGKEVWLLVAGNKSYFYLFVVMPQRNFDRPTTMKETKIVLKKERTEQKFSDLKFVIFVFPS